MANKKVKVSECCVITNDDKGQRSLVGSAKEALTTLSKNHVDVYIFLEGKEKEAIENFLKENNVPFKEIVTSDDQETVKDFDAVVLGANNIVLLRNNWKWALDDLVNKLYRKSEQPATKSEQQKMDDEFSDYKRWAEEANKQAAKKLSGDVVSNG